MSTTRVRCSHASSLSFLSATVERWLAELEAGRPETAWDAFLDRYRALVFAAIRRYVRDHDDVMDIFASVCESLRKDDFWILRRYAADSGHGARFSTWLVTVVRRLCIDWIRKRNGRPRLPAAYGSLSPLQRRICEEVFEGKRSHVEAYERIRSRDGIELGFGEFLRELGAVYRATTMGRGRLSRELVAPEPHEPNPGVEAFIEGRQTAELLEAVLAGLPALDRVAVQMYVVDEVPAADVARVLGLPNPKAVYNRVYRALAALRDALERSGLRRDDL